MAVYKEIESAVIHAGIYGDKYTRAVNVPIYQTSTFEQTGIQENPQWVNNSLIKHINSL